MGGELIMRQDGPSGRITPKKIKTIYKYIYILAKLSGVAREKNCEVINLITALSTGSNSESKLSRNLLKHTHKMSSKTVKLFRSSVTYTRTDEIYIFKDIYIYIYKWIIIIICIYLKLCKIDNISVINMSKHLV